VLLRRMTRWGPQYDNYLINQFRSGGLDPTKTSKADQPAVIAAVSSYDHAILHYFLAPPRGNQKDNTKFYWHYKKAAGEYFVIRALEGVRRKG